MTSKFNLLFFGFILLLNSVMAQNFKLDRVTIEELETTQDSVFEGIDAIILDRNVYSNVGNYIEVYEKIKILNENGLDYATIEFPYYDVYKINGYTYNLVNGEIQQTKLTKDMIFTDKIRSNGVILKDKKATFPQVKVGSVIEIYYRASSGTYSDIYMQYEIPIKELIIKVENSSWSTYRFVQNPLSKISLNRENLKNKILITSKNIPALQYENFVYDMELFRAKLIMQRLGYYSSSIKFSKWGDFPKHLYEMDKFANQVKPLPLYRKEISALIKETNEPINRIHLIYNYFQQHFEWNGDFGIIPDNGSEATFNNKKGSVSDINNLFVSVLRSIGIESYPILASSKKNGIHENASQEAFNYALAGAKISGKWYVFDAANPIATFDYIPAFMINGKGLLIKDNGSFEWIELSLPKISKSHIIGTAVLDEHLELTGSIKERQTGYYGINMRNQIKDSKVEKDSLLGIVNEGLQFKNINIDVNKITADTNISYDFKLEDGAEEIGNEFHLSPLTFLTLTENPFKKDIRKLPIDFGYPYSKYYIFTIKLPKRYQVTYIPQPIKIAMPNDYGSYFYKTSSQGENLQVLMKFQINTSIIPMDYYEELKEFFKIRVEKENEKVIIEPK